MKKPQFNNYFCQKKGTPFLNIFLSSITTNNPAISQIQGILGGSSQTIDYNQKLTDELLEPEEEEKEEKDPDEPKKVIETMNLIDGREILEKIKKNELISRQKERELNEKAKNLHNLKEESIFLTNQITKYNNSTELMKNLGIIQLDGVTAVQSLNLMTDKIDRRPDQIYKIKFKEIESQLYHFFSQFYEFSIT